MLRSQAFLKVEKWGRELVVLVESAAGKTTGNNNAPNRMIR